MPTTADFERMLRGLALRGTRPRVAVLSAVYDHPHADTDPITSAVREDLGEVSHQAVYDVLRTLTAADLVRRFQPTGSVARYEARAGDNHNHVVCRSCGAIADVASPVGYAACLTTVDDSGYEIDETEVINRGRCPECVAPTCAASAADRRQAALRHQSNTALNPEQPTSRAISHQSETARQEKDRRV